MKSLNTLFPGVLTLVVNFPDLILYDKIGVEKLAAFPIAYLRKFGQSDDVFSFEAGRRCVTGHVALSFKVLDPRNTSVCALLEQEITKSNRLAAANASGASAPVVSPKPRQPPPAFESVQPQKPASPSRPLSHPPPAAAATEKRIELSAAPLLTGDDKLANAAVGYLWIG